MARADGKKSSPEREYLEEFRGLIEDGFINPLEREKLEALRDRLGLSMDRARLLEEWESLRWSPLHVFMFGVLLAGLVLIAFLSLWLQRWYLFAGFFVLVFVIAGAMRFFGSLLAPSYIFIFRKAHWFKARLRFCFMESPIHQYRPRSFWNKTSRTISRSVFPSLFAFFLLSILLTAAQPESYLAMEDDGSDKEDTEQWYVVDEKRTITEGRVTDGLMVNAMVMDAHLEMDGDPGAPGTLRGTISGWVLTGYLEESHFVDGRPVPREMPDEEGGEPEYDPLTELFRPDNPAPRNVAGRVAGGVLHRCVLEGGEILERDGPLPEDETPEEFPGLTIVNATVRLTDATGFTVDNATVSTWGIPPEKDKERSRLLADYLLLAGVFVIGPFAAIFSTMIVVLRDSSLMIFSTRSRYLESYGGWLNQRFRAIGGFGAIIGITINVFEYVDETGNRLVPLMTLIAFLVVYPLIFFSIYIYTDRWHDRIVEDFDRRMEKEFPHFKRYTFQEIHNELVLDQVHTKHRRAGRSDGKRIDGADNADGESGEGSDEKRAEGHGKPPKR